MYAKTFLKFSLPISFTLYILHPVSTAATLRNQFPRLQHSRCGKLLHILFFPIVFTFWPTPSLIVKLGFFQQEPIIFSFPVFLFCFVFLPIALVLSNKFSKTKLGRRELYFVSWGGGKL